MESEITKERILEIYLNAAPWGRGVFGLKEAVRHHLDLALEDAGIVELALVASLLPNPARFGPWIKANYLPSSRREKVFNILKNLKSDGSLSATRYDEALRQVQQIQFGKVKFKICHDENKTPREFSEKRCHDI
jgi:membrane peptidoglycan carboxypeptidase